MSMPDLCSLKSSMCFIGCKKYKEKGKAFYWIWVPVIFETI
jgi:hypothetical protein